MRCHPGTDGAYRYFAGNVIRKAELAGGDAAEGNGLQTFLGGEVQTTPVTRCQLDFLRTERPSCRHDGTNGMQDEPRRKIETGRDPCAPRRLFAALHQVIAGEAQLYACRRMDGVVDAAVHRYETTQHLRVGGIYDGIHLQAGDVALPLKKTGAGKFKDSFVQELLL